MRRWQWAGAAAVGVLVVVVGAIVVWPHHHHHTSTNHLALPAGSAPQSPGARQLFALLQTGEQSTWHATYAVTGVPGETLRLEVWQAPPQLREDVVRTASGHTEHSSTYVGSDGTHLCVQQDAAMWACQKVATDPNDIVSSVTAGLAGQSVAVSDASIGGRQVTCFAASTGARICATSGGIPVLVANAQVSYTLASLSSSVSGSSFRLPA